MLITFVKSIQVEAFRTDNLAYTTKMDAAYGEFASVVEDKEGMVALVLYEGITNQRNGTVIRFGLDNLLPDIVETLDGKRGHEARSRLTDNWSKKLPQDKWHPLHTWVRHDNIRGYTE